MVFTSLNDVREFSECVGYEHGVRVGFVEPLFEPLEDAFLSACKYFVLEEDACYLCAFIGVCICFGL